MRKFALNTGASLINEIVTFAVGLILPYLIISHYGSSVNGLVNSITQYLGFIALCELGVGAVIKANLYKPLAEKDTTKLSAVLKSSQIFFRKIAWVLIAYTIVLAFLYPTLVGSEFEYWYSASLIIIISISSFAQYYFGMIYQLLLAADQRAYIQLYTNCVTLIINTVFSYLLIKLNCSIHIVKLVTSFIFIFRPIYMSYYANKHYDINLKIQYSGEPVKQKWNGLAQHIATQVQNSVDVVILTTFSSLYDVSIYGVYNMVVKGIMQLVYTVNAGISALIGKQIAEGDEKKLSSTFSAFEWGMHTVTTVLFSVTGVMIIPFISIYTKGITDANYIIPVFGVLMTICGTLRCIQLTYNVVVQAAGHFKETQVAATIEPIINIVISLIAVKKYGLIGVTIGTVVSLLYRAIYLIVYLHSNILHLQYRKTIKQVIIDLIIAGISIAIAYLIPIAYTNYTKWVISAIIITVIVTTVSATVNYFAYREQMRSAFLVIGKRFSHGK